VDGFIAEYSQDLLFAGASTETVKQVKLGMRQFWRLAIAPSPYSLRGCHHEHT